MAMERERERARACVYQTRPSRGGILPMVSNLLPGSTCKTILCWCWWMKLWLGHGMPSTCTGVNVVPLLYDCYMVPNPRPEQYQNHDLRIPKAAHGTRIRMMSASPRELVKFRFFFRQANGETMSDSLRWRKNLSSLAANIDKKTVVIATDIVFLSNATHEF